MSNLYTILTAHVADKFYVAALKANMEAMSVLTKSPSSSMGMDKFQELLGSNLRKWMTLFESDKEYEAVISEVNANEILRNELKSLKNSSADMRRIVLDDGQLYHLKNKFIYLKVEHKSLDQLKEGEWFVRASLPYILSSYIAIQKMPASSNSEILKEADNIFESWGKSEEKMRLDLEGYKNIISKISKTGGSFEYLHLSLTSAAFLIKEKVKSTLTEVVIDNLSSLKLEISSKKEATI